MSQNFRTPDRKKSHLDRVLQLSSSLSPDSPSKTLLKIPSSPCLKKLGYGTSVNVYLYKRSPRRGVPRSPWAIKKMKSMVMSRDPVIGHRLENEAKILKTIKHPNIIGYRGYKRKKDGSMLLALENGQKSLLDIIDEMKESEEEFGEENGATPFQATIIMKVIDSIAKALDYLHTEKHILHGDLKSGNVLIKGDFETVMLCDFGVTLNLNDDLKVEVPNYEYIGTGPWTAKEAINEDGVISNKTDIFALGCVIFEMLTLETPHLHLLSGEDESSEEDSKCSDESSFNEDAYHEALGTRPELPEGLDLETDEDLKKILGIFYACTEEDPDDRPTAKMILDALKT